MTCVKLSKIVDPFSITFHSDGGMASRTLNCSMSIGQDVCPERLLDPVHQRPNIRSIFISTLMIVQAKYVSLLFLFPLPAF